MSKAKIADIFDSLVRLDPGSQRTALEQVRQIGSNTLRVIDDEDSPPGRPHRLIAMG